jgi:hypothetical protein
MTEGIINEIIALIDRFLSGEETSLPLVNEIEGILVQNFTLEPWFDDALLALAQYRPGGGDHLYNEHDLGQVLQDVRADLLKDAV